MKEKLLTVLAKLIVASAVIGFLTILYALNPLLPLVVVATVVVFWAIIYVIVD